MKFEEAAGFKESSLNSLQDSNIQDILGMILCWLSEIENTTPASGKVTPATYLNLLKCERLVLGLEKREITEAERMATGRNIAKPSVQVLGDNTPVSRSPPVNRIDLAATDSDRESSSHQVFGNQQAQNQMFNETLGSTTLSLYSDPSSYEPTEHPTYAGSNLEDEGLWDENGPNPGESELMKSQMSNMSELSTEELWFLSTNMWI